MVYISLVQQTHDVYGLWMVLKSLDFPDKQDAFGGKNRAWLLTVSAERESLSIKEDCVFGAGRRDRIR